MCNLHWRDTFCTGVTLFALVLHLTALLSANQNQVIFFMCIISKLKCKELKRSNYAAGDWSEKLLITVPPSIPGSQGYILCIMHDISFIYHIHILHLGGAVA